MQKDNVSVLDDLDSDGAVAETTDAIKTVLVPKVQNMDDYLIRHYKSYIMRDSDVSRCRLLNMQTSIGRLTATYYEWSNSSIGLFCNIYLKTPHVGVLAS